MFEESLVEVALEVARVGVVVLEEFLVDGRGGVFAGELLGIELVVFDFGVLPKIQVGVEFILVDDDESTGVRHAKFEGLFLEIVPRSYDENISGVEVPVRQAKFPEEAEKF